MDKMEIIFIISSFLLVFVYLWIMGRFKKAQYKVEDLLEENAKHQNELKSFYQKQKNPLGNLLNGVKEGITLHFDKSGKILYSDKSFQDLIGYSHKELNKMKLQDLISEKPSKLDPLETSIVSRLFAYPKLYTDCETELTTKSGKKIWISWTNRFMHNKGKYPTEVRSVGFDITKRKNLESELKFLASIDPETGLLNRQAFIQTGTRELRRSIRYHHDLSVLILQLMYQGENDLDMNERENFLKQLAAQCKKTLRDVDYLGRIGEVDLAFLLPETNIKNILFLKKRLMENLQTIKEKKGYPLLIRFGACGYTKEKSIDEMIMKAYQEMDKAKGRNNANRLKK